MALPLPELELLNRWRNHQEFSRTLRELGLTSDLAELSRYVEHITLAWFRLGDEHLSEADAAHAARSTRSVYSRSYYAAYNQSKSVRFLSSGFVSLKGDDHQKAGDLPKDFVDRDSWTVRIVEMYEHRLRADYDNWTDTTTRQSLTPEQALANATEFRAAVADYLAGRGVNV